MTTVAVLSGPERRRRWSASQKAQIVEESLASGAVTEVARRHDVHPNLLRHWRRQARQGSGESRPIGFLPVAVHGEGSAGRRRGTIEIELGGVVVRVDAAVDEAALGRVLRAVGR